MSDGEEPQWLDSAQVLCIHEVAIERDGGLPGVRDAEGLDSAVFRPRQFFAYEGERNLFTLAALYAEGIMRNNHPFNDGNKRTGYNTAAMFLRANGRDLQPADDPKQRVEFFERVANGAVPIEELSQFYRDNTVERGHQQCQKEKLEAPDSDRETER